MSSTAVQLSHCQLCHLSQLLNESVTKSVICSGAPRIGSASNRVVSSHVSQHTTNTESLFSNCESQFSLRRNHPSIIQHALFCGRIRPRLPHTTATIGQTCWFSWSHIANPFIACRSTSLNGPFEMSCYADFFNKDVPTFVHFDSIHLRRLRVPISCAVFTLVHQARCNRSRLRCPLCS